MSIKLNAKYLANYVNENELKGIKSQIEAAHQTLNNKTGLGNDFLGWVNLPTDYDKEEFARIKAAAKRIKVVNVNSHLRPMELTTILRSSAVFPKVLIND